MELIKDLGMKTVGERTYRAKYGLFKCPDCKKEVEKLMTSGKKSKNCGCNKDHIRKQRKRYAASSDMFFS